MANRNAFGAIVWGAIGVYLFCFIPLVSGQTTDLTIVGSYQQIGSTNSANHVGTTANCVYRLEWVVGENVTPGWYNVARSDGNTQAAVRVDSSGNIVERYPLTAWSGWTWTVTAKRAELKREYDGGTWVSPLTISTIQNSPAFNMVSFLQAEQVIGPSGGTCSISGATHVRIGWRVVMGPPPPGVLSTHKTTVTIGTGQVVQSTADLQMLALNPGEPTTRRFHARVQFDGQTIALPGDYGVGDSILFAQDVTVGQPSKEAVIEIEIAPGLWSPVLTAEIGSTYNSGTESYVGIQTQGTFEVAPDPPPPTPTPAPTPRIDPLPPADPGNPNLPQAPGNMPQPGAPQQGDYVMNPQTGETISKEDVSEATFAALSDFFGSGLVAPGVSMDNTLSEDFGGSVEAPDDSEGEEKAEAYDEVMSELGSKTFVPAGPSLPNSFGSTSSVNLGTIQGYALVFNFAQFSSVISPVRACLAFLVLVLTYITLAKMTRDAFA